MNQESERDTLRPEYDFSAGVRGTHHRAYRQGTNVVLLDPDVAAVFKDAAAVNSALRALVQVAVAQVGVAEAPPRHSRESGNPSC